MTQRILIVEDDRNARRALVVLVAKLGLIPIEAANTEQAMMRLNRQTDIVCLDLMLPDRSGVEVLRHIRQQNLDTKVAIISGADEPALLAEVTSLKPDAIFGKPLDLEDFFDWLESVGVSTRKIGAQAPKRLAS